MWNVLCMAITLLVGLQLPADRDAAVVVQEISKARTTAASQPIELPRGTVEVIASIYTIAPRAALPVHKHPFPRYAYVLSGKLEVTSADGTVFTYGAGDFIIEMVDAWHRGANSGEEPVRLLVIDQVEAGATNVIRGTTP